MAKEYTKDDLKTNDRIYSNRLRTKVLEEFYEENFVPYIFVFELDNHETIRLIFDTDQFCHLLGFSYFGYNGVIGWNTLNNRNILISNLHEISKHKREEIRITNSPKILTILNNPTIYLYENKETTYKSDYFAVWDDGTRYYKLGIGTNDNGQNYAETYQVSLMTSDDNKEINSKNLVNVINKHIVKR